MVEWLGCWTFKLPQSKIQFKPLWKEVSAQKPNSSDTASHPLVTSPALCIATQQVKRPTAQISPGLEEDGELDSGGQHLDGSGSGLGPAF